MSISPDSITLLSSPPSYRERQQDIFNAMGSMYAAVLFIGITNATAVQPVVSVERFVSYRERAAGLYSALPFAFAQVLPTDLFQFLTFISSQALDFHWGSWCLVSHAGCNWVSLCFCTDTYLQRNFLLPGFIWVDSFEVYLVHLLYVFHFAILHLLWDDDYCCHTQP